MAKFHIDKNGNPGACKALFGRCPYGSKDEHYETPQDARVAYEASMKDDLEDSLFHERERYSRFPVKKYVNDKEIEKDRAKTLLKDETLTSLIQKVEDKVALKEAFVGSLKNKASKLSGERKQKIEAKISEQEKELEGLKKNHTFLKNRSVEVTLYLEKINARKEELKSKI